MSALPANKLSLATMGYISLIALTTLFYELSLIRVLDVLWYPHFAYMVITLALLGFGISGVVTSIISDKKEFGDKALLLVTLPLQPAMQVYFSCSTGFMWILIPFPVLLILEPRFF